MAGIVIVIVLYYSNTLYLHSVLSVIREGYTATAILLLILMAVASWTGLMEAVYESFSNYFQNYQ